MITHHKLYVLKLLLFVLFISLPFSCTLSSDDNHQIEAYNDGYQFSSDIKLSSEEQKTDLKLNEMRKKIIDQHGGNWSFFSSFLQWKDSIQKETLYQTLQKMPKGGMLHIHSTATGDANWIIDRALSMPDCYIYWGEKSENYYQGQLAFFPNLAIPSGWVKIQALQASHPDLKNELHRLFTFGPEDESCSDIWVEFEAIFQRMDGFVSYRPVFIDYYKNAFEILAKDGVQFIELRTNLGGILKEDGTEIKDEELLNIYKNIVSQVNKTFPSFKMDIIVCSWKGQSIQDVTAQVERTGVLKSKYPELIIGFDLVGEEDKGESNAYFTPALSKSQVPLFLHSGESLSRGNHNIQDAIDLKATRIGHGINLFYFPELEQTIIKNNILLEVCPISNQVLRFIPDFRLHPAIGYLQKGIQCTLSSDDPSIFQTQGLTDDFFTAYLSWGLNLASLKKLILNSINFSGLSAAEKGRQIAFFNEKWIVFIREVNGN